MKCCKTRNVVIGVTYNDSEVVSFSSRSFFLNVKKKSVANQKVMSENWEKLTLEAPFKMNDWMT